MRKIVTLADFLFGALLLITSVFAVIRGGRGIHSWPLIPFSLLLISIVFMRLKTNKGHHFGSASWYALAFSTCLLGIFEDYSYVGIFAFERVAEVIAAATASLVLFVTHLRFWLKSKRA